MGLTVLTYHQHHDTYHSIYRALSILSLINNDNIELPRLRILDFYFTFPKFVDDIQFPRVKGASQLKKAAKAMSDPYEILPNKKRLFSEIGDFQIQATHILRAKRIIKENEYGVIELDTLFLNSQIQSLVNESRYVSNEFFISLVRIIEEIPLLGKDGLKRRTGLMEYRYDAI